MGIIIPEVILPSQIKISNVYVSFSDEIIYVFNNNNGSWRINSHYKFFSDQTKSNGTNIRIPIEIMTTNIEAGVYSMLYKKIKEIYPDSVDIINMPVEPIIDPSVTPEVIKRTSDETDFGSNVLARAESYLALNPGASELRDVYNIAELNFYSGGLASTTEMNQILQLLNGYVASSG